MSNHELSCCFSMSSTTLPTYDVINRNVHCVSDIYNVEHPVYQHSYDKPALYNAKLLEDIKKTQQQHIGKQRRVVRLRPNIVSRVRLL